MGTKSIPNGDDTTDIQWNRERRITLHDTIASRPATGRWLFRAPDTLLGMRLFANSLRSTGIVTDGCFANHGDASVDVVDSARMLSFDDERWKHLMGGYKIPFDPRPSLRKLENQQDAASAWEELREELHHQGDVGNASYAAVPELVRIHRCGAAADWNCMRWWRSLNWLVLNRAIQNCRIGYGTNISARSKSWPKWARRTFCLPRNPKQEERSSALLRLQQVFGRTGDSSWRGRVVKMEP